MASIFFNAAVPATASILRVPDDIADSDTIFMSPISPVAETCAPLQYPSINGFVGLVGVNGDEFALYLLRESGVTRIHANKVWHKQNNRFVVLQFMDSTCDF